MMTRYRALLLPGVVLALSGCLETIQKADLDNRPPDAGVFQCGDVGPNEWGVQDAGAAPGLDDAGVQANLFGIWGMSRSAIWAVGDRGRVVFYDGQSWKRQDTPTEKRLTAVWGVSATEVWAVGYQGTVLRFNGISWKDRSPKTKVFVPGDGGPPKGDAALAARRNLNGVWVAATKGGATNAVYAVGDQGLVLHYDAKTATWRDQIPVYASGQVVLVQDQLNAVWGLSSTAVVAVGDFGTALVGNSSRLTKYQTGTTRDLMGVWGRDQDDVYAVGTGGTVLHFRSGRWRAQSGAPKQVLRGVWGPAADGSLAYIVGWDGTLLRITGGPTFSKGASFEPFYCVAPRRRLEAVWGANLTAVVTDAGVQAPHQVWVVGASGMIIRGP
jgi:hypothetical protein